MEKKTNTILYSTSILALPFIHIIYVRYVYCGLCTCLPGHLHINPCRSIAAPVMDLTIYYLIEGRMLRVRISPTRILTNVPTANAPSRSFVKTFSRIHKSSSRYCITLPYDKGDGNAKIDRCTIGTKVCRRTLTIHKDQSWLLLCFVACFACMYAVCMYAGRLDAGRATPPNIPKQPQATPIALGVLCKPTL